MLHNCEILAQSTDPTWEKKKKKAWCGAQACILSAEKTGTGRAGANWPSGLT